MKTPIRTLLAGVALAAAAGSAVADGNTKDIVLDRVAQPVAGLASSGSSSNDAMVVSVLLESPDGSLSPKSVNSLFRTGDRLRVKLLASRDAKVSLYNTNPRGETNPTPVWQGQVRVGQDTITPRLALTGTSGVDQLHVVLEPAEETGVFAWLGRWLHGSKDGASASKDIQLDTQNTATTSYLLGRSGQGLVATVSIVHSAQ